MAKPEYRCASDAVCDWTYYPQNGTVKIPVLRDGPHHQEINCALQTLMDLISGAATLTCTYQSDNVTNDPAAASNALITNINVSGTDFAVNDTLPATTDMTAALQGVYGAGVTVTATDEGGGTFSLVVAGMPCGLTVTTTNDDGFAVELE